MSCVRMNCMCCLLSAGQPTSQFNWALCVQTPNGVRAKQPVINSTICVACIAITNESGDMTMEGLPNTVFGSSAGPLNPSCEPRTTSSLTCACLDLLLREIFIAACFLFLFFFFFKAPFELLHSSVHQRSVRHNISVTLFKWTCLYFVGITLDLNVGS